MPIYGSVTVPSNHAAAGSRFISQTGARWPRFAILAALVILETLLIAPQLKHDDFDQYWAGARLLLQHRDPYNPAALFHLEQASGSTAPRVVELMLPPWTLPALVPLGWLSYHTARLLWFASGLSLTIAAAELLWQIYAVPGLPDWLPLLLALTFPANLSAIFDGQILPVILFCLAAFLRLSRSRHSILLGVSLLGLGIKPHLTYLLALAAGLFLLKEHRWKSLLTIAAGLLLSCALVAWWAPGAFPGYRAAAVETTRVVSGIGGLLRAHFGMQHHWLQFVPLLPGLSWLAWYRPRLRGWDWPRLLPILLLASLVTSVYGWWYDASLLTVALMAAVVRWRNLAPLAKRVVAVGYLVAAAAQAATPMFSLETRFYVWIPAALLLLYAATNPALWPQQTYARCLG